ncbi:MAG: amidohydrolase family protein [Gemmatimonadaceae bacterium]
MNNPLLIRLVLALSGITLGAPLAAQGRTLVLVRANVLDVEKGSIQSDASIVIVNGRIERVITGKYTPDEGAEIVDVSGRYVLPGLIDAHTHISNLAAARRALESGVTTVRSASAPAYQDVGLRELVRRAALAGPDMVATGVFVTPELGESVLADPRLAALHSGVTSVDALREVVRVNIDRGVDFIKTRGTERAGLPNTDPRKQTYTEAQLSAIVDEAAKRNIPVMAHAHGDEGAYAAVRAGVKSIEHGTYLSDSTLRLMKVRGTFFVPTYITVVDLTQPGGDYDNPVLRLRGQHMLPRLGDAVQRAHRLGVKIVTGADTDYGPGSLSRVAGEVESFTQLGLSPLDALRTATTNAAELLGLTAKTGKLAAGFEADLIVVESNPLEDIRSLADVLVVISNGRVALNRLPFIKHATAQ